MKDVSECALAFCACFVDVFPSNCIEWQPLECLTGVFEAMHSDIGKLVHSGFTGSQLVGQGIYFYNATYIVPKKNGWGNLHPIPFPSFDSPEWPVPDNATMDCFRRRFHLDVHSSMKCTYGSHRANLSWFVPIHVFVRIFSTATLHRTPTMWVSKGERALDVFLASDWATKEVRHQGDLIRCSVIREKMIARYYIARQNLTTTFPYRRWKWTNNDWEPLDSDAEAKEEVELQICLHAEIDPHSIYVNDDWHLGNLREYMVLQYAVQENFSFVVHGKLVRMRAENSTRCKDLQIPRIISIRHATCN